MIISWYHFIMIRLSVRPNIAMVVTDMWQQSGFVFYEPHTSLTNLPFQISSKQWLALQQVFGVTSVTSQYHGHSLALWRHSRASRPSRWVRIYSIGPRPTVYANGVLIVSVKGSVRLRALIFSYTRWCNKTLYHDTRRSMGFIAGTEGYAAWRHQPISDQRCV